MALEWDVDALSGDSIGPGCGGKQGIDGMGQVLRCLSWATQDIGDEGLTVE